MNQQQIVKTLAKALFDLSNCYYDANKHVITDVTKLIEIIFGSHITSLYNQLSWATSLSDEQELKGEVKRLFDAILEAMKDSGFSVEKISGKTH